MYPHRNRKISKFWKEMKISLDYAFRERKDVPALKEESIVDH